MGRRGAQRTVPTDAERKLLIEEGFRRVDAPGSPREEWVDVGGQSMAWYRAVELAMRDRSSRTRPTTGRRRAREKRSRAGGSAS